MSKLLADFKLLFKEGPIGVYLMAFFIPLNPRMLGIVVAIIIVEQLIRRPKIDVLHLKSQLSYKNPGIWLLLFYLMHVVGLVNTENMSFAKMDLGMKATLAILPLFFILYKAELNWKIFIKSLIAGAIISIIINIFLSSGAYLKDYDFYFMSGEHLSHMMHRGYWAVYLLLAYFFLLKQMISSKSKSSFVMNLAGALLMLMFAVFSGAKVGLIILFLVTIWAATSLFKRFKNKWILPITVIVLVGGSVAVFYLTPKIANRMTSALSVITKPMDSFDKENPESTTARLMLWDSSLGLIQENFWWGVGTGDIKDELIKRNFENGYTGVAEQKLNSHNQFFNSHIAIGFFGSLFLLLSVVTNYLKRKPDEFRSWRMGIVTILFIALLPESMLETQAGIIPYAFFFTFLTAFQSR